MSGLSQLGAYPSDSWFDVDRPSWLPYWVDDLTESAKKYQLYPGVDLNRSYPAPPPPYTVAPPATVPTATNNDPTLTTQVTTATQARRTDWLSNVLDPFFQTVDDETTRLKNSETPWLLYASLAVVGVLILRRR